MFLLLIFQFFGREMRDERNVILDFDRINPIHWVDFVTQYLIKENGEKVDSAYFQSVQTILAMLTYIPFGYMEKE